VVDLSTGSRRDDVTASVGELRVSKSGRFVVLIDYDRQHSVTVHCLDGLLQQLEQEDIDAGLNRRCPGYVEVDEQQQQTATNRSNARGDCAGLYGVASQHESEMNNITIDDFIRRCRRPPPPPVCTERWLLSQFDSRIS